MNILLKLISINVVSIIVMSVSGSYHLAILSFFTLLFHWLAISQFLKEPSLQSTCNILIFYSFILCIISIISYEQSVTIGGELTPYLGGSDGQGYIDQALLILGDDKIDRLVFSSAYFGYQYILSFAFDIFGANLFVGLLLNNTLLLLTVLLIVRIAWILTNDHHTCFYSALAFILTAKFIYYSNTLLKDPFIILGVALLSYMITKIHVKKAVTLSSYLALILAALIFGMMRQPMLAFIPISFIILGRTTLKAIWLPGFLFFLLGAPFIAFTDTFTSHVFLPEMVAETVLNNQLLSRTEFYYGNIEGSVKTISNLYLGLPVLIRILLVVIPGSLHFILPFNFWSTAFINDHLINFFNSNLNIIWYLFVGVFMIYGAIYWRRLPKNMATRLFLFGVASYLFQAFVFAGVVPRYASPFYVMMYPTIGFLMSCLFENRGDYIHIKKFFQSYYFLVFIIGILFVILSLTRST